MTVEFFIQNITSLKKSLGVKDNSHTLLCVDGKEQRGTGKNYNHDDKIPNLQSLHVYNASDDICLYSKAIDSKTNEIPVAQNILKTMDLKGCIVTFDALHTQRDTVVVIRSQKGDYYETIEKAHGKIECRKYYCIKAFQSMEVKKWEGLKSFICFDKTMADIKTNKKTTETRYYVSSFYDVVLAAEAIRGHWSVESKLHWHLDYSFNEDENTTMDKKAFHNYSLLNKMALSLCKLARPVIGASSIRSTRKCFGWNYQENASRLLSCFDDETIKNAMIHFK